jgi:hypothetical protein
MWVNFETKKGRKAGDLEFRADFLQLQKRTDCRNPWHSLCY